jgi:hypothetical protein
MKPYSHDRRLELTRMHVVADFYIHNKRLVRSACAIIVNCNITTVSVSCFLSLFDLFSFLESSSHNPPLAITRYPPMSLSMGITLTLDLTESRSMGLLLPECRSVWSGLNRDDLFRLDVLPFCR